MNKCWKILIVDDEESIHAMTKLVVKNLMFEDKAVEFYSAYSGKEAKRLFLEIDDIAIVLLDIAMETKSTGLDLVKFIRNDLKNKDIRIIVRTGQPGTAPESEVILKYDINDYREKTELNYQKLITSILVGLRSYRDLKQLRKSKEELLVAKSEAEKASKIKLQFLSNMSHEMRTPMNGIMGIAQLLAYTDLSEQQKEYVELLKESTNRLMYTINDILDLSKIESGIVDIKRNPFSLKDFYLELVDEFRIKFDDKNLKFEYSYDSRLSDYRLGDKLKLYQIVFNILSNAYKFTQKGGVIFKLKLEEKDKVLIEIEDTGIGIDVDSMDKIFDIFTQGDESNTRKFGGTGLGLAITNKLVKMMNGTIDVKSTLGKGSLFILRFELPIIIEKNLDLISSIQLESEEKIRILLAEDDFMMQEKIIRILKKITTNIDVVIDGQEVITKAKEFKYDLIIMDISLPIIDGIQSTKFIRALEIQKNTSIIALIAHEYSNTRKMCLENGMNDYLLKSFKMTEMYSKILLNLYNKDIDFLDLNSKKTDDFFETLDYIMDDKYIENLIQDITKYYNYEDFEMLRKTIKNSVDKFRLINFKKTIKILKTLCDCSQEERNDFLSLIEVLKSELSEIQTYYKHNKLLWRD